MEINQPPAGERREKRVILMRAKRTDGKWNILDINNPRRTSEGLIVSWMSVPDDWMDSIDRSGITQIIHNNDCLEVTYLKNRQTSVFNYMNSSGEGWECAACLHFRKPVTKVSRPVIKTMFWGFHCPLEENNEIFEAEMYRVYAEWNHTPKRMCNGFWILEVDGIDVTDYIPLSLQVSSMYTLQKIAWEDPVGNSCIECFGDTWKTWKSKNDYWLSKITSSYITKKIIYLAIQEQDFVKGCCGGCLLD